MLDNNHMTRSISLIEAVPYLRAYANQIFVVKVGGELMEDPELLNLWRETSPFFIVFRSRLLLSTVGDHSSTDSRSSLEMK